MRGRLAVLLLVAVATAFGAGLVALLELRFAEGDVYPAYSSLRADPLGTRALYEALDELPDLRVERGYTPLDDDNGSAATVSKPSAGVAGTTAFVLGAAAETWQYADPDNFGEVERFLEGGGRVVLTFQPATSNPYFERRTGQEIQREHERERARPPGRSPRTKRPAGPRAAPPPSSSREGTWARERWGVDFRFAPVGKGAFAERAAGAAPGVENQVAWRSGVFFDRLSPEWTVAYERDGHPVLASRPWGRGTLVLASDSYFLSNEGVRKDRAPSLLTWLIGSSRRVRFDETHLGLNEEVGVMTLVRRYGLLGFVLVSLLIFALFVWKSVASFLPRGQEADARESVVGRESFGGLVNLLRRSLPKDRLLGACIDEWERATPGSEKRAAEMRDAASGGRGVRAERVYERLTEIAKRRERTTT